MLRVQPSAELGALEKETLANMEHDGLRHTQFVKSLQEDRKRAEEMGWAHKLLDFRTKEGKVLEAVLDSTAGYIKCSAACAHFQKLASDVGVKFQFGAETKGVVTETSQNEPDKFKAIGLELKDGAIHYADIVVVAGECGGGAGRTMFRGSGSYVPNEAKVLICHAAGAYSTQLLPALSYHLEASAGSVAAFKIEPSSTALWDKYSSDNFPVITWKSRPRSDDGKDVGSVYVQPRTDEGILKIGYRGVKVSVIGANSDVASYSNKY